MVLINEYDGKVLADMIKSMTGFGRYESDTEERKITVEMKAVNHRYCEISIRMPKKLNFFEAGIRNVLKQYMSRGKLDMFISCEDYCESKSCVKYNEEIAKEYYKYFLKMKQQFGISEDINISNIARMPEVFTLEEQGINETEIWMQMEDAIRKTAEKFVETRISEGENLKQDITLKLGFVMELVAFIELRSPEILKEYRQRLTDKVRELLGDTKLDEGVLATELTIFADKICVDEETVRLRSHVQNMMETLADGENIGRKLDFIAQEMNREANTILSKANDLAVTGKAIDLKSVIEKIREQIQNIE